MAHSQRHRRAAPTAPAHLPPPSLPSDFGCLLMLSAAPGLGWERAVSCLFLLDAGTGAAAAATTPTREPHGSTAGAHPGNDNQWQVQHGWWDGGGWGARATRGRPTTHTNWRRERTPHARKARVDCRFPRALVAFPKGAPTFVHPGNFVHVRTVCGGVLCCVRLLGVPWWPAHGAPRFEAGCMAAGRHRTLRPCDAGSPRAACPPRDPTLCLSEHFVFCRAPCWAPRPAGGAYPILS